MLDAVEIILANGEIAIVDKEDSWVNDYLWFCKKGYVVRSSTQKEKDAGLPSTISLHRQLLNYPEKNVDHIDRNKLNNRRLNLRLATRSQNSMNRTNTKPSKTSKYKGVFWRNDRNKWVGQIFIGSKSSKYFNDDELEAATWYNNKAKELHGEFACLNEI